MVPVLPVRSIVGNIKCVMRRKKRIYENILETMLVVYEATQKEMRYSVLLGELAPRKSEKENGKLSLGRGAFTAGLVCRT